MRLDFSTIPYGKVFKPTEEEFKNFRAYITSLENNPECQNHGIIKVKFNCQIVPPKSFFKKIFDKTSKIKNYKVHNPLQQEIYGDKGKNFYFKLIILNL